MIKITALNKKYKTQKRKDCHALNNINLTLPDKGLVFVLGKSGSGKSTLLNLIGGLDSITSGTIEVDGNDLSTFKEKDFCNYRNTHIGFIFQDYHLIDELTVYENIVLSLNLRRIEDKDLVQAALEKVDLAGYEDRYPTELSGGEQQRVAIARAIVKNPRIILADEPTGNLDTHTATAIVELLKELSKECLILIVSHNVNDENSYADRIIELKKGKIISDKSRNPEFANEIVLKEDTLIYPDGQSLSDKDIDLLNENVHKKIIKCTDKFISTPENTKASKKIKIENKKLSLGKELNLSGKFLKNKSLAITLSAFMVSVIMIIMALAQTIVNFDGSHIIADEMAKSQQSSVLLNKTVDAETEAMLDGSFRIEIGENDIQSFYDVGYKGKIYPVINVTVPITEYKNAAGVKVSNLSVYHPYLRESLGTIVVDEDFLERKFGEINYLAKAEEYDPAGVIITDYIADSILFSHTSYVNKSYEDIVGPYIRSGWSIPSIHINAVIDTGYKEKYAELLDQIENAVDYNISDLYKNEAFVNFSSEINDSLGFSYSLNPDFERDFIDNWAWRVPFLQKMVVNDLFELEMDEQGRYYTVWGQAPDYAKLPLKPNAIADDAIEMNVTQYNALFGTNYDKSNLDTFIPHKIQITQYRLYDINQENPVASMEVLVSAVVMDAWCLGDSVARELGEASVYYNALYFDGTDGIGNALNVAGELNYEPQSVSIEGIHSMTRAVDVFVPIFELISIFLYIGVIFILMNFASKMINDKMHEIGILKALGTKNGSIGVVFGLQVGLIALLTCGLSTLGYYLFVDVANDILIESIHRIAPSWTLPDLQFLTFKPEIALMNCLLIFALAFVSLIFPMIKIKAIKPVKIIKAKE